MPRPKFNSETGAAAGRKSKRRAFDQRMQDMLSKRIKSGMYKGMSREEALLEMMYNRAMDEGDAKVANALLDRGHGKARTLIELEADATEDFLDMVNAAAEKQTKKDKKKGYKDE
jgi:hypothetical protein